MWISMKEFRAWEWSSVDDGSHYDPKKADQSLMDDSVAHVSGMAQAQGRMGMWRVRELLEVGGLDENEMLAGPLGEEPEVMREWTIWDARVTLG